MPSKKMTLIALLAVLGVWALMSLPSAVYAFTPPTSGSFAYDVYDIAVKKIAQGPIGFVSGVGGIILGVVQLFTGRIFSAVPCVLGGALILKSESITTSLGLLF
jgi:hypothetical protein